MLKTITSSKALTVYYSRNSKRSKGKGPCRRCLKQGPSDSFHCLVRQTPLNKTEDLIWFDTGHIYCLKDNQSLLGDVLACSCLTRLDKATSFMI